MIKLCRSRGYYQLEDDVDDTDDEEVYGESFQRRIAAPSFNAVLPSNCDIDAAVKKKKKELERDKAKKRPRKVIVQSPSYLRSDLEDSLNFNDDSNNEEG